MAEDTELTHAAPLWPHGPSSLMHLVRRASQRTTASWAATVTTGLSAVQYAILVVLAEVTTCDQQTLGARAGFDKATGTYLIDRMAQAGLIETHPDPVNRRRKLVSMTDSGRAVLATMAKEAPQAEALFSSRLNEREIGQLNRLLSKLTDVESDAA